MGGRRTAPCTPPATRRAKRLAALGAAPEDLQAFARAVAFDTLHSALNFLDNPAGEANMPGWALIETSCDRPTGRLVRGLYEDLDPDR